MKNRNFKSRRNLYRLLLFVAVIAAAFIFDHFNKNEFFNFEEAKDYPATNTVDLGQFFYYNPVKVSNHDPVTSNTASKLFDSSQAKFLQQYHSLRNFHLAKFEKDLLKPSDFLLMHKVLIKQIHYTDPLDIPPLS